MSLLARGIIFLTISNAIFLGSGYIVQVLLGRFFTPAEYGLFGVLIYIVNILNTIFASGFLEGVSRTIARKPQSAYTILKKGIVVELIISGGLGLLYFLLSPFLADLLNAPDASRFIAFSALLIPLYGIRTVYIGFLNGLKRFEAQSLAVIAAAIVKVGLVIVFVILGYGLLWILGAYFLAALTTLIVAHLYVRHYRDRTEPFAQNTLFRLALILSVYASLFPLLTNIDLLFIKGIIADAAVAGYYNAATTLARFPQFLFGSLGAVLLPLVASAYAEGRHDEVRRAIRAVLRYGIIILAPIVILSIATSNELITLVYTDTYIPAVAAFNLLVIALSILALVQVLFTTLISIGAEKHVLWLTFLFLAIDAILLTILTPQYGMTGAAAATLSITVFAFFVCVAYLTKKLQTTLLTLQSGFRILLSLAILWGITTTLLTRFTFSHLSLIFFYVAMLLVYTAVLFILREITPSELRALRHLRKS